MTTEYDVPVLIVGAGPAGATAAIELARHGVEALVAERRPVPGGLPRATSVSMGSMELLRSWGLEDEVRAGAVDVEWIGWSTETLAAASAGSAFPVGYPTRAESERLSPTAAACVPQDHVEPILLRHLRSLGGALERGTGARRRRERPGRRARDPGRHDRRGARRAGALPRRRGRRAQRDATRPGHRHDRPGRPRRADRHAVPRPAVAPGRPAPARHLQRHPSRRPRHVPPGGPRGPLALLARMGPHARDAGRLPGGEARGPDPDRRRRSLRHPGVRADQDPVVRRADRRPLPRRAARSSSATPRTA